MGAKIMVAYSTTFHTNIVGMLSDDGQMLLDCFATDETPQGVPALYMIRPMFLAFSVLGIRDEINLPITELAQMQELDHYDANLAGMLTSIYYGLHGKKQIAEFQRKKSEPVPQSKDKSVLLMPKK